MKTTSFLDTNVKKEAMTATSYSFSAHPQCRRSGAWLGSRHVDLDVVRDAAHDRVVGPRSLQDRARHELRDGAVGDQSGDEPLPRDAAADVAVEPEAAVRGSEDLARADRVRL